MLSGWNKCAFLCTYHHMHVPGLHCAGNRASCVDSIEVFVAIASIFIQGCLSRAFSRENEQGQRVSLSLIYVVGGRPERYGSVGSYIKCWLTERSVLYNVSWTF